jgi:hypothetical protein
MNARTFRLDDPTVISRKLGDIHFRRPLESRVIESRMNKSEQITPKLDIALILVDETKRLSEIEGIFEYQGIFR